MPLGNPVESESGLCDLLGWHLVDEGGQSFERGGAFLQARNEPLADESGYESLEFQPGGINSEFAVNVTLYGSQFFQGPQPNAHGCHADPDPIGDFLHRERDRRTDRRGQVLLFDIWEEKRKMKVEAEKSFQCSVFSFQGRGERWRRRRES